MSGPDGARNITIAQALRDAAAMLTTTSTTPRLDAELLMAHALTVSRSELLLHHMTARPPARFGELIARRGKHEPVAYILGEQAFYGLDFKVSRDVLIPRSDSETLVDLALKARPDARRILDCGTGSGALLLAVLHHLPTASGTGIDASEAALAIARANAANLGLNERAAMIRADWHEPGWQTLAVPPFDLILANPPYVEAEADLAPGVRAFEPGSALFAGPDGLDDYRALIPQLPELLSEHGQVFLEIGATQADAVTAIARSAGFAATLHHDLNKKPRVLQLLCKR